MLTFFSDYRVLPIVDQNADVTVEFGVADINTRKKRSLLSVNETTEAQQTEQKPKAEISCSRHDTNPVLLFFYLKNALAMSIHFLKEVFLEYFNIENRNFKTHENLYINISLGTPLLLFCLA
jgi:hypothetical protein